MSQFAPRPLVAGALFALLAACTGMAATPASAGGEIMIADGATFTLQAGATVVLADASTLRYIGLVNDSRCPPDVQCIWAGDAEIELAWQPSAGTPVRTFSLHTGRGDKSAALGARRVALMALARGEAPVAELQVERAD